MASHLDCCTVLLILLEYHVLDAFRLQGLTSRGQFIAKPAVGNWEAQVINHFRSLGLPAPFARDGAVSASSIIKFSFGAAPP